MTPPDPSPWRPPYRMPSGPHVAVVAARTPEGVYRAINPCAYMATANRTAQHLVESLVRYLGAANLAAVEWTGYAYPRLPAYLAATLGVADRAPFQLPTGVWFYPWLRAPHPTAKAVHFRYGWIATEGRKVADLHGHRP